MVIMNMNIADKLLNVNGVLVFMVLILYSFFSTGDCLLGFCAGLSGLAINYSLILLRTPEMSEKEIRRRKQFAPFAGWILALWVFGVLARDCYLLVVSIIPLLMALYYMKRILHEKETMKIETIDILQHANAAAMLGFCVLYPFFNPCGCGWEVGLAVWAFGLLFLYWTNLVTFPKLKKDEMTDAKKTTIPISWFFILFWWGVICEDNFLKIAAGILFIFAALYLFLYIRKWRREYKSE
jgi:hypothetical protein